MGYGAIKEVVATSMPSNEAAPTTPSAPVEQPPVVPPLAPMALSARQESRQSKRQRRQERYAQVRRLHQTGQSVRCIAETMGLSRETVAGYLRQDQCPNWRPSRERP